MNSEPMERYEPQLMEDDDGNIFLLAGTEIHTNHITKNSDKSNENSYKEALEEEKINKVRTTHFGRWLTSSGMDESALSLEAITREIKSKYAVFMYEIIKESREFKTAECDKELLQDFFSAVVGYLLTGANNTKTETTDLKTYELHKDADYLVESMYNASENSDLELLSSKYFDDKVELFRIVISLVDSLVDISLIIWKDDSDLSGGIPMEA